jgi:hypothetical protein
MSTHYTTYPQYPAQQQVVQPQPGTNYQTAYDGQQVYPRDSNLAIQDRAMTAVPAPTSTVSTWFDIYNPSYVKGVVVGAGVTLLVTNPAVQNAVVKGAVAVWSGLVGGIEEIKERVRDARAEKSLS